MEYPKRKRLRLPDFDYTTQGAYFVTLCTQDKKHLFQIDETDKVIPEPHITHSLQMDEISMQNRIIHHWINEIHNKFQDVKVDKYVIMPNHIHLIVFLNDRHTACPLQDVMRWFKTMTTNAYIKAVEKGDLERFDGKLWQRGYYDHIIRNEQDYLDIWNYIDGNPSKWFEDPYYIL